VSLSTPRDRGFLDTREVIRPIQALDVATGTVITLESGAVLESCCIHRSSQAGINAGAEPYLMQFESGGARYVCALVHFQPRTQSTSHACLETEAASEAIAVRR
jgi:hypothetical protein